MGFLKNYGIYKTIKGFTGGGLFRSLLALALIPVGKSAYRRFKQRGVSGVSSDMNRAA